jgi:hypothetical protein
MRDIPKIIHYCWFGKGEKPQDIKNYFLTWKKNLPDYQFIEWNEENINIDNELDYVKEAYQVKKYAFVSDYIRLKVLYEYGGVYLDTDIEVLKPFDEYLDNATMVLGFESKRSLLTAFIAVEKGNNYIKEFLKKYEKRHFILQNGEYDMSTINYHFTTFATSFGVNINNNEFQEIEHKIMIYPIEYFSGFDVENWHPQITGNTCLVHHMASSWVSGKRNLKGKVIILIQNMIGVKNYEKLRKTIKRK